MKVLVVGGGGREHALCWGLKKSPKVTALYCAPGNPGIAQVATRVAIPVSEIVALADFADQEQIDLIVVGPEAPLVAGLSDLLRARSRRVFGCSKAASEIEASKAFAKDLMARHKIPTGAFGVFSEIDAADLFIDRQMQEGATRLVVKADGLAQGKGVVIANGPIEAKAAARSMLEERRFGEAGSRVVIEEFLVGREASLMALVCGESVTLLASAEDHKTIFDGDQGPMTGGMGTVSPTPVLDELTCARAVKEIFLPTARGLAAEGRPFEGLLYAGLMLTARGPKVLEFNCRFGDPETQSLVYRWQSDLFDALYAIASGQPAAPVKFSDQAVVCVVTTAAGYPDSARSGDVITGNLSETDSSIVFHAGTGQDAQSNLITAGGRVLGVTARGQNIDAARALAYARVEDIHYAGKHYRHDIGKRGNL